MELLLWFVCLNRFISIQWSWSLQVYNACNKHISTNCVISSSTISLLNYLLHTRTQTHLQPNLAPLPSFNRFQKLEKIIMKHKMSGLSHIFMTVFLYNFSTFMVIPAIPDVTMSALCPGTDHCSFAIYITGFQQAVPFILYFN